MMEYKKQLSRIAKALEEIPYTYAYVEIKTREDKFIYEKDKNTKVLGFRKGVE